MSVHDIIDVNIEYNSNKFCLNKCAPYFTLLHIRAVGDKNVN